ncbi:tagaturonate epimerase family protein [Catenovulum sp. 2E275]|uniref:tagaturonate epimerase family protein n=1 Tax=Catenovulum sp. 2E275 TaxID=2980497 RepID=UPI0021CF0E23|nr:tagaturonate epimerase family protein [Catenovulum sp. 2E275]MCU4674193.1 tagaturonate epimerase family protein [Catenovulum sp. 2E275]
MLKIEKYTIGVGDRFGHQAEAQLQAMIDAKAKLGVDIYPVWNKSNREHQIIGTVPQSLRDEADAAVKVKGWDKPYFVDADHIQLGTVDSFIACSDFFTLDVAEQIGLAAPEADIEAFVKAQAKYIGELQIPGIEETFHVTEDNVRAIAKEFLGAVKLAKQIFEKISANKSAPFVTEVSMDECENPQTPLELFFILSAIAQEGIPAQTVAPKFTGRFNKGVDYVGDVAQFDKEFDQDLAVIAFAIKEFGLPETLKLSVHSGSDKFSIYESIGKNLKKHNAGIHLKTAGTTWLEELIGLAEAGGEGLVIAKEVYAASIANYEALCAPYATVIDIDASKLPTAEAVNDWTSDQYVNALRHDLDHPEYNPNVRQLLHVGYKVAAQMGDRYLQALKDNKAIVGKNVTENIYDRHISRIFG